MKSCEGKEDKKCDHGIHSGFLRVVNIEWVEREQK
jgi:hypothetical protein